MKRHLVIFAISLIVTGLLSSASMSFAQQGGKWAKKAPMPTPRAQLSVAVVNNVIYAMGGFDGKQTLKTVEAYNPLTDKWEKKADMSSVRRAFATCVVNGKIYAVGGLTVVERRGKKIEPTLQTVEAYDTAADAWEGKAAKALEKMNHISAAVLDGKIYIMAYVRNVTADGSKLVQIYDPATDTWAKGPELGVHRFNATGSAANGKVYVIAGFQKDNIQLAVVEEFDPGTNTWIKKKDIPTPRHEIMPTSPVAGGKIYVIGGVDNDKILGVVEEYDPAADKWAEKKAMPTKRRHLAAATVRGKIYAIGGSKEIANAQGFGEAPGDAVGTVEEYTPEGWPFAVSPQGKLATTWGTLKTMY